MRLSREVVAIQTAAPMLFIERRHPDPVLNCLIHADSSSFDDPLPIGFTNTNFIDFLIS